MPNKTRHQTDDLYDTTQHSLASLLLNRGHSLAAAVVAMARYRCDQVDNLAGGQYEITLEVPAEAYDIARGELLVPGPGMPRHHWPQALRGLADPGTAAPGKPRLGRPTH